MADIVFQTQQDSCTYELIVAVTVCMEPEQSQVRQNPSLEREGWHKFPFLGNGSYWQLVAAARGTVSIL